MTKQIVLILMVLSSACGRPNMPNEPVEVKLERIPTLEEGGVICDARMAIIDQDYFNSLNELQQSQFKNFASEKCSKGIQQ